MVPHWEMSFCESSLTPLICDGMEQTQSLVHASSLPLRYTLSICVLWQGLSIFQPQPPEC
jgi:hypothetical protein